MSPLEPSNTLLFSFEHASVGRPDAPILRDFTWRVESGQSWVITGPNSSGKSALAQALAGALPVAAPGRDSRNSLPAPQSVSLISFERQREVFFDERYHDDSEFIEGGVDPGTPARDFILGRRRGGDLPPEPARFLEIIERLGIASVLDTGLKYLSTGELRKALLSRELLRNPGWLVFDEPFEGLDAATREVLACEIESLVQGSISNEPNIPGGSSSQVLVITDRYEHVPASTTHVLFLDAERRVRFCGPRAGFESSTFVSQFREVAGEAADLNRKLQAAFDERAFDGGDGPLVSLRDVTVSYAGRKVLDHLSLDILSRQHTLVRGPNGCGKTTLLNLINGDGHQVYANDVTVCGIKRGSGETIWQVKSNLGQVSYALHVEHAYNADSNLIHTVVSGYFDSIGLGRRPSPHQVRHAERWLEAVGLSSKRDEPFLALSFGEQRLALILRAVIKQPPLLILDEPCHGLDTRSRGKVLAIADYIGHHTSSTVLYVTHDPAEQLSCTRQVLEYEQARGWLLSTV